ncbi:MAG: hypothetical protein ACRD4M_10375, partial [Candidatus Acidiferrales bacterium]
MLTFQKTLGISHRAPLIPSRQAIEQRRQIGALPSTFKRIDSDSSKCKFAFKLNVARASYAEVRVKTPIVGRSRDLRASVRRGLRKVRMVEGIEKAGPELKSKALAESESPLQGNIPVRQPRSNQGISWASSPGSGRRILERVDGCVGL